MGAQDTVQTPKPIIRYDSTPKRYTIADIQVTGINNYEDYILIGLSGLSVGQTITVPSDDITEACNRYWKHGLFSNVQITAEKIEGNKIWLKIWLTQRPRVTEVRYNGVKKSERSDLELRLNLVKGMQVTPNLIDRARILIKRYFDDKGYKNADVVITQEDDKETEGQVYVNVDVDKHDKIKVNSITIVGNEALKTSKLKRVMKKTNEKGKLVNIFRTKKFVDENFEADKQLILDKYNELGYRDAAILKDSVTMHDDRSVDVYLELSEGEKYYLRNITWVGNTIYPSEVLNNVLQMKSGDVYNQKILTERISTDDDAVSNLYYNNGYIFARVEPVETNIVGDSIDMEVRISEGQQATINKIIINGNDRVYDDVVRRELYTRPGQLFSREELMRSLRQIQQMGHFDEENINPNPIAHPENGTVDLEYNLVSKSNDQVEFSAGWGQTGVIGRMSLKFTNFSVANLLHPGQNYRAFLPQGDGQTLTLSAQTNADYYQQYSISFMDPWFGGKRPNMFSLSAYYSLQTDVSSQFYNDAYYSNMYNSYYSGMMGYGSYNNSYYSMENYYDPDKSVKMFGLSIMWGRRLKWPDDYFTFTAELSYQRYILNNWQYFAVTNGNSNNLSINLTLSRSSTGNPFFPTFGSDFTLSAQITPPYSL
ncbi:MAG: BamA/TamA family outer membrane protein, partial [Prevotellaceae bacterium]|nr:BamA/TamA family outer membrane protein [Prevotellaceae bacterium]